MSTIDILILVGFIVLAMVVAFRIYLRRKQAVDTSASVKIKQPDMYRETAKKVVEPLSPSPEPERVPQQKTEKADSPPKEQQSDSSDAAVEESKVESSPKDEEVDPMVLIKTFSAAPEKRIPAMQVAGEKRMKEAVPALIEALYEPDASISSAAAEALGIIGDPRAIEPLLEISRRNDVQLMKEIAENRPPEPPPEEKTASAEIPETKENPYNFKEMVVFKIDQLPKEYFQSDGSPIPRKDLVIRGLKDNNQQLRQMAAKAAIGLDSEDVVDPLIEALENPYEVESVRFMAAEALGGMENDKSVESLLKALKDENVAVRYSAAAALSGKNEDPVVLALIGAINDEDKYVRSSVAYALGATRHPKALTVLFECVSDESDVVSFSAAKAVACYNSDDVIKEVKERFEFANHRSRLALIEVLGHIKNIESVKMLRELLQSDDSEITYKASMALMGQENLEILDELIDASKRLDNELMRLLKSGKNEFASELGPKIAKSAPKGLSRPNGHVHASEAVIKLRDGLKDQNPNIRGSAANALGDHREAAATDLLLEVIDDENEFVRASVIGSLGRIGDEIAIEAMIQKADDYSEEVRYALVKALAKFEDDRAVSCLNKLANSDSSNQVKRAARTALDKK